MDRVCRITITSARGSTPRNAGTEMLVWADGQDGTIGGGQLEYDAIMTARRMLSDGTDTHTATYPLGPTLGQCCGGSVSLRWKCSNCDGDIDESETFDANNVWIFGSGHVGRAVAAVLSPLPDFNVTLIDTTPERMADVPGTTPIIAANPVRLVPHAPVKAHHLIMTYSHALDLDLCHALLAHPADSIGLIGSATKWARFSRRLTSLGHAPQDIARIRCPIGDPTLGKHPQQIAVGIATQMLGLHASGGQRKEIAS